MKARIVERPALQARGRSLDFSQLRLMGVLNVTPDSFSDGGQYLELEAAVARGLELLDQGADILDVGGISTRPGAEAPAESEEMERVVEVVRCLRSSRPEAIISLDTYRPKVAAAAIEAGADIINDIRGLAEHPELAEIAASAGAAMILMHSTGLPKVMQQRTLSASLETSIGAFLGQAAERAMAAGLPQTALVIDPGFGFGKTWSQNLELLGDLDWLHDLGLPLLLGLSRKSFLGWVGGVETPAHRDPISHAGLVIGALSGAHILRVHDMEGARQAARLVDALIRGWRPETPDRTQAPINPC